MPSRHICITLRRDAAAEHVKTRSIVRDAAASARFRSPREYITGIAASIESRVKTREWHALSKNRRQFVEPGERLRKEQSHFALFAATSEAFTFCTIAGGAASAAANKVDNDNDVGGATLRTWAVPNT